MVDAGDPRLMPGTNTDSERIKDPEPQNSWRQEECFVPLSWAMISRQDTRTTKTDELDFIKTENFCSSKDTIKRMKRQPTDWKKIFASHLHI